MQLRTPVSEIQGKWKLPPLILHPFTGEYAADSLLQGSKASMALESLALNAEQERDRLTNLMLNGRIQELKMLYFLGKDVMRWMEQCVDFARRNKELSSADLGEQSFSDLLIEDPPPGIHQKLRQWGVADSKSVFSRAVGLNTVLAVPPSLETLATGFVQNYHRYADYLYICFQNLRPFTPIRQASFSFELYASAEYSQMLSEQWHQSGETL